MEGGHQVHFVTFHAYPGAYYIRRIRYSLGSVWFIPSQDGRWVLQGGFDLRSCVQLTERELWLQFMP